MEPQTEQVADTLMERVDKLVQALRPTSRAGVTHIPP